MNKVQILLVEDSEDDILITRRALKKGKIKNDVHVVMDGEAAMDFLHKRDEFSNAVTPDLILLDLNLPKKNGKEVLAEVKTHPDLKHIPVVVLTTSTADKDIIESYNLYANCYVSKPLNFGKYVEIVSMIENFWFSIVKLPENDGSKF